ncbi:chloramphenicol acetyltransferase [Bacillus sp. XF8]|uniref:chloramphenicol acetyltransferase n=1 Tax=Bacillus sp. XF8 TaxID=2819289 RepID=UPI001AA092BD|nr:chloramphenicol acetyltransferase [Bacillus sp. XF8]MBO1581680.1 chloramphenicol acetyltransferase [Bacillus sp. XF8]
MAIICLEGPSAVGKTTTCQQLEKEYDAYIIPEVNLLFERPKNEHKTWYLERQVERWHIAVQQSKNYEFVVLDGDVFQPLSYNWCFHFEVFDQSLPFLEEFYKNSIRKREIGFPDQYFYLYTSECELRKRKGFDYTRKRRNFEKHIHITKPHKKYYQHLNNIIQEYCKLIEAKSVENNVKEIMEHVFIRKTNTAQRYDVTNLGDVANWLKLNRA